MRAFRLFMAVFTLLCCAGALLAGGIAQAMQQPLIFGIVLNADEKRAVQTHPMTENLPTDNQNIAKTDLNNDFINELIIRECNENDDRALCSYTVFAHTNKTLIILGEIKARALSIGSQYTNGVRDLYARVPAPTNDYESVRYIWEQTQSRYILSGETL